MGARWMVCVLGLAACFAAADETRLVIGDNGTTLVQTTCTRDVAGGVSDMVFASLPDQMLTESLSLSEPAGTVPAKILSQKFTHPDKVQPGGGQGPQCAVDYSSPDGYPHFRLGAGVLQYTLDSPAAGPRTFTLTYLLYGLSWQADYNAFLSADRKSVRFEGWLTLSNQTSGQFANPMITLARSATENMQAYTAGMSGSPVSLNPSTVAGFAAGGYMPLEGAQSLLPYSTLRLPLINTAAIAVTPYLQCDIIPGMSREDYMPPEMAAQSAPPSAWWWFEVDNKPENGMGKVLPRGSLRVFQPLDQGMTLSGGWGMDTTQPGQKMRIRLSPESGITAKKRVKQPGGDGMMGMGMRPDGGGRNVVQTIVLTSTLNGPREVLVHDRPEVIRRSPAISDASDLYKTLDDGRLEFRVEVTPGTERVITYSVAM